MAGQGNWLTSARSPSSEGSLTNSNSHFLPEPLCQGKEERGGFNVPFVCNQRRVKGAPKGTLPDAKLDPTHHPGIVPPMILQETNLWYLDCQPYPTPMCTPRPAHNNHHSPYVQSEPRTGWIPGCIFIISPVLNVLTNVGTRIHTTKPKPKSQIYGPGAWETHILLLKLLLSRVYCLKR